MTATTTQPNHDGRLVGEPTTTASPTRRTTVGLVRAMRIFTGRSLRHSLRDGEGLLMAVLLPVMLMLLFTTVFGGAIMSDGGYLEHVVPGVIVLTAGFGASSVAVAVATDLATGAVDRFRGMPIPSFTVVIGHVAASVVRNMFATLLVLGVGFAIGFRASASPLAWLGALAIIALYVLAITLVFAFIGLVSGSPEAANGYGFVILFLPYLSSAFVPIETMPEWLQPIATYQPITPIIETVRGLFLTGEAPDAAVALAWTLGLIALGAGLIAIRFPRSGRR